MDYLSFTDVNPMYIALLALFYYFWRDEQLEPDPSITWVPNR